MKKTPPAVTGSAAFDGAKWKEEIDRKLIEMKLATIRKAFIPSSAGASTTVSIPVPKSASGVSISESQKLTILTAKVQERLPPSGRVYRMKAVRCQYDIRTDEWLLGIEMHCTDSDTKYMADYLLPEEVLQKAPAGDFSCLNPVVHEMVFKLIDAVVQQKLTERKQNDLRSQEERPYAKDPWATYVLRDGTSSSAEVDSEEREPRSVSGDLGHHLSKPDKSLGRWPSDHEVDAASYLVTRPIKPTTGYIAYNSTWDGTT